MYQSFQIQPPCNYGDRDKLPEKKCVFSCNYGPQAVYPRHRGFASLLLYELPLI